MTGCYKVQLHVRYYNMGPLIITCGSTLNHAATCYDSNWRPNWATVLFTSNYWFLCQSSCFWNMFWKEDYVVGTFKNICTVAIHCWYIKYAFARSCQQVFEKKKFHILLDTCFHSSTDFKICNIIIGIAT